MSDLSRFTVVDFCVFSQRLGASRGIAWRSWKEYNNLTSWRSFCEAWKAARASEELAGRYPGLAR